jgi:hypothetical protein
MYIEYPIFYGKKIATGESIEGDYLMGEGDRTFIIVDKKKLK